MSKAKKVYFCDTGLLDEFSKIAGGSLFENSVYNNLRQFDRIQYYQKTSGREIDFVLDAQIGIEVKLKGIQSDLNRLRNASSRLGLKEQYVISKEFVNAAGFISAVDL